MSIIVLSYLFSNLYDGLKLGKEPPIILYHIHSNFLYMIMTIRYKKVKS